MKRLWLIAILALGLAAGSARAAGIGGSLYGGMAFPILQDDQGTGSIYGVRVPVKLVPLFTVEPFYSSSDLGDKTLDIAPGFSVTRDGSAVKTYGVNALLTMSGPISFYPFLGFGSANFKREGQDETMTSYDFGLGVGFAPIPKFSIDVRGELQAAVADGASRKMFNATLGASYSFFSMP